MIFSTSSSEKTWNNSRRRSFCFLQQWPAEPLAGVVQFRWIVKPTWLVVTVVLASQHWARSRRWCHGEWYQISCLQVGGLHFQSGNIARSSDQSATGGHTSNGFPMADSSRNLGIGRAHRQRSQECGQESLAPGFTWYHPIIEYDRWQMKYIYYYIMY